MDSWQITLTAFAPLKDLISKITITTTVQELSQQNTFLLLVSSIRGLICSSCAILSTEFLE
jgi:hypothetical protein